MASRCHPSERPRDRLRERESERSPRDPPSKFDRFLFGCKLNHQLKISTHFSHEELTRMRPQSNLKYACQVAVLAAFVYYAVNYFILRENAPSKEEVPLITYFPQRVWRDSPIKTIFLWTYNFEDRNWGISMDYKFDGCQVSSCRVTKDLAKLEESDAVLFHARNQWNYFLGYPVPANHPAHQVWILHDFEPPPLVYLDMHAYRNVFNWTMNYRRDSDVQSSYGKIVRHDDETVSWDKETDPQILEYARLKNMPHIFDHLLDENYHRKKTKFAAWTSSNCIPTSRRRRIINELKKYFPIDSYGACDDLRLNCSDLECKEELSPYRFYFAFENSFCKDYATEKLYNSLRREQIPVVLGGADFSPLLPQNTYIDATEFDSIHDLAHYLIKVNASEPLYNSYMWWRKYYSALTYPPYWCDLCEALHDSKRSAQVYSNLLAWYRDDLENCRLFSVYDAVTRALEGWLLMYNWIS